MRVKPVGNGGHAAIIAGESMPGLRVTGKLSNGGGIGFGACGSMRIGDPRRNGGIYQKRRSRSGEFYVKMKNYGPANPRTPAQQANRAQFAAAVAAWGDLTDSEKKAYNQRAGRRGQVGRWLFLREYLENSL